MQRLLAAGGGEASVFNRASTGTGETNRAALAVASALLAAISVMAAGEKWETLRN